MGFWGRLFGKGDDEDKGKPQLDAIEDEVGTNRTIEVAHKEGERHGPYRRFRPDGSLLEEGMYVDGKREGPFVIHARDARIEGSYHADKRAPTEPCERSAYKDGDEVRPVVVTGPYEERDKIHENWITKRGTLVGGKRDGVWEEFGVPNYDAPKGDLGPLMRRWFYKDGVLDGRYETWGYYANKREIEGQYENGKRVGHWIYYRHGDTIASELDYEQGKVMRWRWLTRDGRERSVVPLGDDDEDPQRWIWLGDAWDNVAKDSTYPVELALDNWPDGARTQQLAWIDDQIANEGRPEVWTVGTRWLQRMADNDEIDPHTKYVNAIEVDHEEWDDAQRRRLQRFAPQIVRLGLHECIVKPNVEALFDVAWPRLAQLMLGACGPLDELLPKLATSPLVDVALWEEPLSHAAIAQLVELPWFANLEALALTIARAEHVGLLAGVTMPALRSLEFACGELELAVADVVRLFDRERRPALEKFSMSGGILDGELPSIPGLEIRLEEL